MAEQEFSQVNPETQKYRVHLKSIGEDTTGISDEALTYRLGQLVESKGKSLDTLGPKFKQEYLDIKNAPDPNMKGILGYPKELWRSLRMTTLGMGGTGLAGAAIPFGTERTDGIHDWLTSRAQGLHNEASRYRPTITRPTDIRWNNLDEAMRGSISMFGQALPSLLQSLTAGKMSAVASRGVGTALARKIPKKAMTTRTRKGFTENISKRDDFIDKIETGGMAGGMALNSIGMNAGEIYSSLIPYTDLPASHPEHVPIEDARWASLMGGAMSGSLDALFPAFLLNKFMRTAGKGGAGYWWRFVQSLPKNITLEGATEGAQELINMMSEKYARGHDMTWESMTRDEKLRLIDAGALGAVGGMQGTLIEALHDPTDPDIKTPDQLDQLQKALEEIRKEDERAIEAATADLEKRTRLFKKDEVLQNTSTGVTGVFKRDDGDKIIITNENGKSVSIPAHLAAVVPQETDQTPVDEGDYITFTGSDQTLQGITKEVSDDYLVIEVEDTGKRYKIPREGVTVDKKAKDLAIEQALDKFERPDDDGKIRDIKKSDYELIAMELMNTDDTNDVFTDDGPTDKAIMAMAHLMTKDMDGTRVERKWSGTRFTTAKTSEDAQKKAERKEIINKLVEKEVDELRGVIDELINDDTLTAKAIYDKAREHIKEKHESWTEVWTAIRRHSEIDSYFLKGKYHKPTTADINKANTDKQIKKNEATRNKLIGNWTKGRFRFVLYNDKISLVGKTKLTSGKVEIYNEDGITAVQADHLKQATSPTRDDQNAAFALMTVASSRGLKRFTSNYKHNYGDSFSKHRKEVRDSTKTPKKTTPKKTTPKTKTKTPKTKTPPPTPEDLKAGMPDVLPSESADFSLTDLEGMVSIILGKDVGLSRPDDVYNHFKDKAALKTAAAARMKEVQDKGATDETNEVRDTRDILGGWMDMYPKNMSSEEYTGDVSGDVIFENREAISAITDVEMGNDLPAIDVIDSILKSAPKSEKGKYAHNLLNRIRDLVILSGVKINFIDWETFNESNPSRAGLIHKAAYDHIAKRATITDRFNLFRGDSEGNLAATIAHELLHPVWSSAKMISEGAMDKLTGGMDPDTIQRLKGHVASLTETFQRLKDKGEGYVHGFKNIDEFFVEFLSNSDFANSLKSESISVSSEGRTWLQSLWQWIVDALTGIIQLITKKGDFIEAKIDISAIMDIYSSAPAVPVFKGNRVDYASESIRIIPHRPHKGTTYKAYLGALITQIGNGVNIDNRSSASEKRTAQDFEFWMRNAFIDNYPDNTSTIKKLWVEIYKDALDTVSAKRFVPVAHIKLNALQDGWDPQAKKDLDDYLNASVGLHNNIHEKYKQDAVAFKSEKGQHFDLDVIKRGLADERIEAENKLMDQLLGLGLEREEVWYWSYYVPSLIEDSVGRFVDYFESTPELTDETIKAVRKSVLDNLKAGKIGPIIDSQYVGRFKTAFIGDIDFDDVNSLRLSHAMVFNWRDAPEYKRVDMGAVSGDVVFEDFVVARDSATTLNGIAEMVSGSLSMSRPDIIKNIRDGTQKAQREKAGPATDEVQQEVMLKEVKAKLVVAKDYLNSAHIKALKDKTEESTQSYYALVEEANALDRERTTLEFNISRAKKGNSYASLRRVGDDDILEGGIAIRIPRPIGATEDLRRAQKDVEDSTNSINESRKKLTETIGMLEREVHERNIKTREDIISKASRVLTQKSSTEESLLSIRKATKSALTLTDAAVRLLETSESTELSSHPHSIMELSKPHTKDTLTRIIDGVLFTGVAQEVEGLGKSQGLMERSKKKLIDTTSSQRTYYQFIHKDTGIVALTGVWANTKAEIRVATRREKIPKLTKEGVEKLADAEYLGIHNGKARYIVGYQGQHTQYDLDGTSPWIQSTATRNFMSTTEGDYANINIVENSHADRMIKRLGMRYIQHNKNKKQAIFIYSQPIGTNNKAKDKINKLSFVGLSEDRKSAIYKNKDGEEESISKGLKTFTDGTLKVIRREKTIEGTASQMEMASPLMMEPSTLDFSLKKSKYSAQTLGSFVVGNAEWRFTGEAVEFGTAPMEDGSPKVFHFESQEAYEKAKDLAIATSAATGDVVMGAKKVNAAITEIGNLQDVMRELLVELRTAEKQKAGTAVRDKLTKQIQQTEADFTQAINTHSPVLSDINFAYNSNWNLKDMAAASKKMHDAIERELPDSVAIGGKRVTAGEFTKTMRGLFKIEQEITHREALVRSFRRSIDITKATIESGLVYEELTSLRRYIKSGGKKDIHKNIKHLKPAVDNLIRENNLLDQHITQLGRLSNNWTKQAKSETAKLFLEGMTEEAFGGRMQRAIKHYHTGKENSDIPLARYLTLSLYGPMRQLASTTSELSVMDKMGSIHEGPSARRRPDIAWLDRYRGSIISGESFEKSYHGSGPIENIGAEEYQQGTYEYIFTAESTIREIAESSEVKSSASGRNATLYLLHQNTDLLHRLNIAIPTEFGADPAKFLEAWFDEVDKSFQSHARELKQMDAPPIILTIPYGEAVATYRSTAIPVTTENRQYINEPLGDRTSIHVDDLSTDSISNLHEAYTDRISAQVGIAQGVAIKEIEADRSTKGTVLNKLSPTKWRDQYHSILIQRIISNLGGPFMSDHLADLSILESAHQNNLLEILEARGNPLFSMFSDTERFSGEIKLPPDVLSAQLNDVREEILGDLDFYKEDIVFGFYDQFKEAERIHNDQRNIQVEFNFKGSSFSVSAANLSEFKASHTTEEYNEAKKRLSKETDHESAQKAKILAKNQYERFAEKHKQAKSALAVLDKLEQDVSPNGELTRRITGATQLLDSEWLSTKWIMNKETNEPHMEVVGHPKHFTGGLGWQHQEPISTREDAPVSLADRPDAALPKLFAAMEVIGSSQGRYVISEWEYYNKNKSLPSPAVYEKNYGKKKWKGVKESDESVVYGTGVVLDYSQINSRQHIKAVGLNRLESAINDVYDAINNAPTPIWSKSMLMDYVYSSANNIKVRAKTHRTGKNTRATSLVQAKGNANPWLTIPPTQANQIINLYTAFVASGISKDLLGLEGNNPASPQSVLPEGIVAQPETLDTLERLFRVTGAGDIETEISIPSSMHGRKETYGEGSVGTPRGTSLEYEKTRSLTKKAAKVFQSTGGNVQLTESIIRTFLGDRYITGENNEYLELDVDGSTIRIRANHASDEFKNMASRKLTEQVETTDLFHHIYDQFFREIDPREKNEFPKIRDTETGKLRAMTATEKLKSLPTGDLKKDARAWPAGIKQLLSMTPKGIVESFNEFATSDREQARANLRQARENLERASSRSTILSDVARKLNIENPDIYGDILAALEAGDLSLLENEAIFGDIAESSTPKDIAFWMAENRIAKFMNRGAHATAQEGIFKEDDRLHSIASSLGIPVSDLIESFDREVHGPLFKLEGAEIKESLAATQIGELTDAVERIEAVISRIKWHGRKGRGGGVGRRLKKDSAGNTVYSYRAYNSMAWGHKPFSGLEENTEGFHKIGETTLYRKPYLDSFADRILQISGGQLDVSRKIKTALDALERVDTKLIKDSRNSNVTRALKKLYDQDGIRDQIATGTYEIEIGKKKVKREGVDWSTQVNDLADYRLSSHIKPQSTEADPTLVAISTLKKLVDDLEIESSPEVLMDKIEQFSETIVELEKYESTSKTYKAELKRLEDNIPEGVDLAGKDLEAYQEWEYLLNNPSDKKLKEARKELKRLKGEAKKLDLTWVDRLLDDRPKYSSRGGLGYHIAFEEEQADQLKELTAELKERKGELADAKKALGTSQVEVQKVLGELSSERSLRVAKVAESGWATAIDKRLKRRQLRARQEDPKTTPEERIALREEIRKLDAVPAGKSLPPLRPLPSSRSVDVLSTIREIIRKHYSSELGIEERQEFPSKKMSSDIKADTAASSRKTKKILKSIEDSLPDGVDTYAVKTLNDAMEAMELAISEAKRAKVLNESGEQIGANIADIKIPEWSDVEGEVYKDGNTFVNDLVAKTVEVMADVIGASGGFKSRKTRQDLEVLLAKSFNPSLDKIDASPLRAYMTTNKKARYIDANAQYFYSTMPVEEYFDRVEGRPWRGDSATISDEAERNNDMVSREQTYNSLQSATPPISEGVASENMETMGEFLDGADPSIPTSSHQVINRLLSIVDETPSGQATRRVAKLIQGLPVMDGVKVVFEPWETFRWKARGTPDSHITTAAYDSNSRTIYISEAYRGGGQNPMGQLSTTISHELLHPVVRNAIALTEDGLVANREMLAKHMSPDLLKSLDAKIGEIKSLYEYVKSQPTEGGYKHGLVSLDEFIIEALTNDKFATHLKGIKIPSSLRTDSASWIRTAWEWVLDLISRIITSFHSKPDQSSSSQQTAYKRLMDDVDTVFSTYGKITKDISPDLLRESAPDQIYKSSTAIDEQVEGEEIEELRVDENRQYRAMWELAGVNNLIDEIGRAVAVMMNEGYVPPVKEGDSPMDGFMRESWARPLKKNLSEAVNRLSRYVPEGFKPEDITVGWGGNNTDFRMRAAEASIRLLELSREQMRKVFTKSEKSLIAKRQFLKDQLEDIDPENEYDMKELGKKLQKAFRTKIASVKKRLDARKDSHNEIRQRLDTLTHIKGEALSKWLQQLVAKGVNLKGTPEEVAKALERFGFTGVTEDSIGFDMVNSQKTPVGLRGIFASIVSAKPVHIEFIKLTTGDLNRELRAEIKEYKNFSALRLQVELDNLGENKDEESELRRMFLEGWLDVHTTKESIAQTEKVAQKASDANDALLPFSKKLQYVLGAAEPFSLHEGAVMLRMKTGPAGEWESDKPITITLNNKMLPENREEFNEAIRQNLKFLEDENVGDEHKSQPYYRIIKRQTEIAMHAPLQKEHAEARRASYFASLQALGHRFATMGYQGKNISAMLHQVVVEHKKQDSYHKASALKWNRALKDATQAMGYDNWNEFIEGPYSDALSWIEAQPHLIPDWDKAISMAWDYLVDRGDIKDKTAMADNARKAFITLMKRTDEHRRMVRDLSKAMGVKIASKYKGDSVMVESLIEANKMVELQRDPIEQGAITVSRRLNGRVKGIVDMLHNSGWANIDPLDDEDTTKIEGMTKWVRRFINPTVVDDFIAPYATMNSIADVFSIGSTPLPQTKVEDAWNASEGIGADRFMSWAGNIASITKTDPLLVAKELMNRLHQHFGKLNTISKSAENLDVIQIAHSVQHKLMDGRDMDSVIPREFYTYDSFDEVNTNIQLATTIANAVMGRGGESLRKERTSLMDTLREKRSTFGNLITRAGGKFNVNSYRPNMFYSRSLRNAAEDILLKEGATNPRAKFEELRSAARQVDQAESSFKHLENYYGGKDGPYQDVRWLTEMLGMHAFMILSQPKSSILNFLSIPDIFVFSRGLNKLGLKGTAKALQNVFDQGFGGMMESFGIQMAKTHEYAQDTGEMFYHFKENELPFRDFSYFVGLRGVAKNDLLERSLTGGLGPLPGAKGLTRLGRRAPAGIKNPNRAPLTLRTMMPYVGDPFGYVGRVANHSIAFGLASSYHDVVLEAAKYLETNNLVDSTKELTAKDVGYGKGVGAWGAGGVTLDKLILGGEEGWENFNIKAIDAGLGSITQMARDYLRRGRAGDKRVLTKDQTLSIGVMGMTEVALDGFLARPPWLYTTKIGRVTAPLMGWSLARMNQVNEFMRTKEGKLSGMMFAKYMFLISASMAPVGLMAAATQDIWDEDILDKPNSLQKVAPTQMIPLVGMFMNRDDPRYNPLAMIERLGRTSSPYGLAYDAIAAAIAQADPYSPSRGFSVDSRVLLFSQAQSMLSVAATLNQQGFEADYKSVYRPLMYSLGLNAGFHYTQALTNAMGIDSQERRIADISGLRNDLRAGAKAERIPLQRAMKFAVTSSKASMYLQQMQRAAYAMDNEDFFRAYSKAVGAVREELKEKGRMGVSAEAVVLSRFKARDPMRLVTDRKMTPEQWARISPRISQSSREKMQKLITSRDHYMNILLPPEAYIKSKKTKTPEQLRRELLRL
jgi:hypothetical protein